MRPALLLLAATLPAEALEVRRLDVRHEGRAYYVETEALIDTPPATVRALLLDTQAMPRINPSVRRVSQRETASGQEVDALLEECFLGFCQTLRHVQAVRVQGDVIESTTLPVEGSGFASGTARCELHAEGAGTRLVFRSRSEPAFWLPPFIGPLAVMRQLKAKARLSLENLERLARG